MEQLDLKFSFRNLVSCEVFDHVFLCNDVE